MAPRRTIGTCAIDVVRTLAFGINMAAAIVAVTAIRAYGATRAAKRNATMSDTPKPNTVERLRELLLALYVSGVCNPDDAPVEEHARLLDIVLAAGEGRPFADLGLPFPPR